MKKCLVCGFETENDNAMFCNHCGNRLSEEKAIVTLKFDRNNLPYIRDGFERYLDNAEEAYAAKNAVNLGVNLRVICEGLLEYTFSRYPGIQEMDFNSQLEYAQYNGIIDASSLSLLNSIRLNGNRCAHGNIDTDMEYKLNYEFKQLVNNFNKIIRQMMDFVGNENTPDRLYKSREDYQNAPLLYRDKKEYAKKLRRIYFRSHDILSRIICALVFALNGLGYLVISVGIMIACMLFNKNIENMFSGPAPSMKTLMIGAVISVFALYLAYYIMFGLPKRRYKKDQKGYGCKEVWMDFSSADVYCYNFLVDYSIDWKELKALSKKDGRQQ